MAETGYFNSDSDSGCKLQKYQNGELKEVVDSDVENKALSIKKFTALPYQKPDNTTGIR